MEDAQPNEIRKGSTTIPRVRTTRQVHGRPSRRTQSQSAAPARSSSSNGRSDKALVEVHLPRECHIGAPGSHQARKRWIEDQRHYLRTNRHLSVVSFKYLDCDRSVLFTCRRATQSAGHCARGSAETVSRLVNAHLGTESIGIIRQGAVVPSLVKAHENHSDFAQCSEPGPSRIESLPLAGPRGGSRRLDNHSSNPCSGHSVERKLVESSTTVMKWRQGQAIRTNSVSRQRVAMRTAPPTESIIDLTLDPSGPLAEDNSTRWLSFRSGCVDIYLPPLSSGSRESSFDASTCLRPSIDLTPEQLVEQCEDMPVVRRSNTNPRSPQPNIRLNNKLPVRSMKDHGINGSLSDQLRQRGVPEVAPVVRSRDYSVLLEDEAEIPPDSSPLLRGFGFACDNLSLSLGPRDRPRRILHDDDFAYVVTAHGIIDQIRATNVLKLDRNIRSPPLPFEEFVDDACILSHQGEPVVILGHARKQNQITFLNLKRGQVPRHITLRRNWNTTKRPGVSAMTSLMSPLKFASGGHDHRVHLWDIAQDLSGASTVELPIKHTSVVHSLLPIVDTSHKLVSVGADCQVPIYDMSAERVVRTLKVSCIPYHAHKTDFLYCTLLEVSHLETQFEVRDHRMPNRAVQRFGFIAEQKRGRFEKADTRSHFVVCGDRNGAVHLWDLRNVSTEVALRQCFNDPVIQIASAGPRLLACSKRNELAWIDFQHE